jgi:hypothetical protein
MGKRDTENVAGPFVARRLKIRKVLNDYVEGPTLCGALGIAWLLVLGSRRSRRLGDQARAALSAHVRHH